MGNGMPYFAERRLDYLHGAVEAALRSGGLSGHRARHFATIAVTAITRATEPPRYVTHDWKRRHLVFNYMLQRYLRGILRHERDVLADALARLADAAEAAAGDQLAHAVADARCALAAATPTRARAGIAS